MGPRKDRIVSSLFLFLPSFLFSFFFLPPISQCCIQRSQQTKILIGPDEKEKSQQNLLSLGKGPGKWQPTKTKNNCVDIFFPAK